MWIAAMSLLFFARGIVPDSRWLPLSPLYTRRRITHARSRKPGTLYPTSPRVRGSGWRARGKAPTNRPTDLSRRTVAKYTRDTRPWFTFAECSGQRAIIIGVTLILVWEREKARANEFYALISQKLPLVSPTESLGTKNKIQLHHSRGVRFRIEVSAERNPLIVK